MLSKCHLDNTDYIYDDLVYVNFTHNSIKKQCVKNGCYTEITPSNFNQVNMNIGENICPIKMK